MPTGESKKRYKVFLVVVFNVWNGVTTGTLVVPTFQEGTTIFHHCDGGVRTPVEGMVSQKYNRSDRRGQGAGHSPTYVH